MIPAILTLFELQMMCRTSDYISKSTTAKGDCERLKEESEKLYICVFNKKLVYLQLVCSSTGVNLEIVFITVNLTACKTFQTWMYCKMQMRW